MSGKGFVLGQRVAPEKLERARELRRAMTPEETTLWHRLRHHRLGGRAFRRQQVVDGFIVDFVCLEVGLVVEVDGAVHRGQAEYDAERDRALAARGLRVMRVSNDDVRYRLPIVLERIRATCDLTPTEPVMPHASPDTAGMSAPAPSS